MSSPDETGAAPPRHDVAATRRALQAEIAALLPDLRGFARFLVRDRAAADDVLQDGLVRALGAIDQFQPGTNLKAWLFTIVRNTFYEGARRRKREARMLEGQEAGGTETLPQADARAAVRDLDTMLWQLPPSQREALLLVGVQELSYEEAAAVCGVPVGTIKARVSRGRAALSDAVRRAGDGEMAVHSVVDT